MLQHKSCLLNMYITPVCHFSLLKSALYRVISSDQTRLLQSRSRHHNTDTRLDINSLTSVRVWGGVDPLRNASIYFYIRCSFTFNVSCVPRCNYGESCTCGGGWSMAETTSAGLLSGFSRSTGIFSCNTQEGETFTQNALH